MSVVPFTSRSIAQRPTSRTLHAESSPPTTPRGESHARFRMSFERLLVPFRDARVIRHGGGLLVVDKPVGIPVHGGDETLGGDLVTRLGEWLRAHGSDEYLGVHQRLDLGTSGVIAFTTERERNAGVARAVEEHRF